jgi:hypothetical protein
MRTWAPPEAIPAVIKEGGEVEAVEVTHVVTETATTTEVVVEGALALAPQTDITVPAMIATAAIVGIDLIGVLRTMAVAVTIATSREMTARHSSPRTNVIVGLYLCSSSPLD